MNLHRSDAPLLKWSVIESSLDTFMPSTGGFTNAKRGFVTLPNGETVFIKVGTDTSTRLWAHKEIAIYNSLIKHGFEYIPTLLSVNEDSTGFALENLSIEDGWEWETRWSKERLNKTLEAMDSLALLDAACMPRSLLDINMINEQKNSWLIFIEDRLMTTVLQKKLEKINRQDLVERIIKSDFLKNDFGFSFIKDSLVHNDVRRDNCAWNQRTQQVRLIDWNWLQLGDQCIDVNSLLVNAYKSGLDLADGFSDRLNKSALLWLAGYWFSASIQSSDINISEVATLRDYQLESAVSAYELTLKF